MDVLRERQVKDNLERQLQDEQKVRGKYFLPSSILCFIHSNIKYSFLCLIFSHNKWQLILYTMWYQCGILYNSDKTFKKLVII